MKDHCASASCTNDEGQAGSISTNWVAHTPGPNGKWHDLFDHLKAVASLAQVLGDKFGAGAIAYVMGMVHDIAKADPRFQQYLKDCYAGRQGKGCPHSAPSAAAAKTELGSFVLPILGHHAGIPDKVDAQAQLQWADIQSIQFAKGCLKRLHEIPSLKSEIENFEGDTIAFEMFIRMAFSCLVDADFLDTEAHFSPSQWQKRGGYPSLAEYQARLDVYLQGFSGKVGLVNETRVEILAACRHAAKEERGAFRLTVPTGGGKTLSGMAFALDHAVLQGLDRIIVAIPYTSIIDQTASLYKGIFSSQNVLEHHSSLNIDPADVEQGELELRRRLSAENWDCPLVVTTTVQLFESLFHNRPSRCRKLHNVVNSVIVLDEVQALPAERLKPVLDILQELVSRYRCTVVFCSATQLDYSKVDDRLLRNAKEIVPNHVDHFARLKRVAYQVEQVTWTEQQAATQILEHDQALAVFNTKKDALHIARVCQAMGTNGLVHLSTLLCGHHRKRVIEDVRAALEENRPIHLISTQVIEAGVDVDFPIVFRDVGPLDRIIQVAGRCNREGRRHTGTCVVFQLEGSSQPSGAYRTAIEATRMILQEFGANLDDAEALTLFSRELFAHTATDRGIQSQRAQLNFRTVAKNFKLIEQDTIPLIVEGYFDADVPALIAAWHTKPHGWFRTIAPYTVSVYDRDLERLQREGQVRQHESGAWIYSGRYDEKFGVSPDFEDPADLIV